MCLILRNSLTHKEYWPPLVVHRGGTQWSSGWPGLSGRTVAYSISASAYTGARVGEMAQLRKQDIQKDGDNWIAIITPEAGAVKNKRPRKVVLHRHLIELGFPAFVRSSKGPYLFLNAHTKQEARGRTAALKNRIGQFVRGIVSDVRVAPSHGWRHRFMTVGREVGIEDRVLEAISGRSPASVGARYGDVTVAAQARAMAMFPRYEVDDTVGSKTGPRNAA